MTREGIKEPDGGGQPNDPVDLLPLGAVIATAGYESIAGRFSKGVSIYWLVFTPSR
jgi:hypothetical protein